MTRLFPHFSEYQGVWPWKNFAPREVACKHCGELCPDPASLNALQALRNAWGKPIVINSWQPVTAERKKRTLKALLELLLSTPAEGDCEGSNGEAMCAALVKKAIAGDMRAFSIIRDTVGEKPTNKVAVNIHPESLGVAACEQKALDACERLLALRDERAAHGQGKAP